MPRCQRGFTLVELVAVMSILAVLIAVVAPNFTGLRRASVQVQALQDAVQVRTAALDFFKEQKQAGVLVPHTVTTATKLPGPPGVPPRLVQNRRQTVNTKWPERFLTLQVAHEGGPPSLPPQAQGRLRDIGAGYAGVFPTGPADNIAEVVLLDQDGELLPGDTFLARFTAIDLATLEARGFLGKRPAGAEVKEEGFPRLLWLFEKRSAGPGRPVDRAVAVFELVTVERLEDQFATTRLLPGNERAQSAPGRAKAREVAVGPTTENKVKLTYRRIG